MRNFRNLCLSAAAASLLLAAGPVRATTFTDRTFNLADYSSTVYSGVPVPSSTIGQTADGNPGTAYEVSFDYGPVTTDFNVLATALNNGFRYDPGTSGAITRLGVSLDRYFLSLANGVSPGVAGYTLRPLIFQDGQLYEASFLAAPGDGGATWNKLVRKGLTASDFGLFDPNNLNVIDYSSHPDFGGSEIIFGFAMRAGGGGGSFISPSGVLRADNFVIGINGGVPEPATWAMMMIGFGAIGGAMRHRRQWRGAMLDAAGIGQG